MKTLSAKALSTLSAIGIGLDKQMFPEVKKRGIVVPSTAASFFQPLGQETEDGKGKGRSETGSGQGTTGREGSAGGSRETGSSASVVLPRVDADALEQDVAEVCETYPGSQIMRRRDGFWLLAPAEILEDIGKQALLVVAVPSSRVQKPQGWAFWRVGDRFDWIGPRHTNFPSGSICAFDPNDGTWQAGNSLVTLLDLYSVWVARQLYLENFGRWPGSQIARWAVERLTETQPGELCGCGSLNELYEDCCRPHDSKQDWAKIWGEFLAEASGGKRQAPVEIVTALRKPETLPRVFPYIL